MPRKRESKQRRPGGIKLARAKLRHFIFTIAPDRLTRGLLKRRHMECPIALRELTLHVPSWPEQWEGLRIAHVSDFHLGELMPMPRALEIVERVAQAKPDLLACTGDVVDLEWRGAEPLLEAMGSVAAPLGRYLVLGNHDHLDDPDALMRAARRRGLVVLDGDVEHAARQVRRGRGGAASLREQEASLEVARSSNLRVGGIDWGRTRRELRERIEALRERPDLLLAHNPKAFMDAARLGVPLTLAGHTHGGQVALPDRAIKNARVGAGAGTGIGVAPARANVRALRRGLYAQGDSRLFVNVGAGSWFPARINCPAEILMLTVKR